MAVGGKIMSKNYTVGKKSESIYEKSCEVIPGGVNSPVRAFGSVGSKPFIAERGSGSHIYDADGREYIDLVCSWGPLILGHAKQEVISAVREKIEKGLTFGMPTEDEYTLAKMICEAIPSVEMLRMTSSGTEAAMSAVRLARAFTGRSKILKFDGCYHGHSDSMLVKAGSGLATQGIPNSAGVPAEFASLTLTAPYNDLNAVEKIFGSAGKDIAAIIVEPVAGNMGVVRPKKGFLEGLRRITEKYGSLLILDEVITGFRVTYGGIQNIYNIKPDITVLGKIIGGGMPAAAFGGRKDIMKLVAPLGGMYQAGTLSGNPIATAAGIETLKILKNNPKIYEELEHRSQKLEDALEKSAEKNGIPLTVSRAGSLMTAFFTDREVTCFDDAKKCDTKLYSKYFSHMLASGVFVPPSQFEAMFLSSAHTDDDISVISSAFDSFVI